MTAPMTHKNLEESYGPAIQSGQRRVAAVTATAISRSMKESDWPSRGGRSYSRSRQPRGSGEAAMTTQPTAVAPYEMQLEEGPKKPNNGPKMAPG